VASEVDGFRRKKQDFAWFNYQRIEVWNYLYVHFGEGVGIASFLFYVFGFRGAGLPIISDIIFLNSLELVKIASWISSFSFSDKSK
jgi:hypothetical protein